MAQEPTHEAGSFQPSAEGASGDDQRDASGPVSETALRRELETLRAELRSAGHAYRSLTFEVEALKKTNKNSQQFTGKLAPLTKVNGKKPNSFGHGST